MAASCSLFVWLLLLWIYALLSSKCPFGSTFIVINLIFDLWQVYVDNVIWHSSTTALQYRVGARWRHQHTLALRLGNFKFLTIQAADDLNLAVIKKTRTRYWLLQWVYIQSIVNDHISGICQSILTNEVSKCEKLNCTSCDNLYFPTKDENLKISVPKATVWKLLLNSIDNTA